MVAGGERVILLFVTSAQADTGTLHYIYQALSFWSSSQQIVILNVKFIPGSALPLLSQF